MSWPKTREEHLQSRRSRRVAFFGSGVVLIVAGIAGLLWMGVALGQLTNPLVLPSTIGTVLMGIAMVVAGRLSPVTEDTRLPTLAELPADDPRRARSLAERRRDWSIGMGICLLGWPVAVGTVMAPGVSGLVRVGLFFACTYGALFIGAMVMRQRTGSTNWPRV